MGEEVVTDGDFKELFKYFVENSYSATTVNATITSIQEKCEKLFAKDYRFSVVENTNGDLCNTYPSRIIFLEGEKENEPKEKETKSEKPSATDYRKLVLSCREARCRTRFPVPVILFDGKFICRSSTLASGKEIYPRQTLKFFEFFFFGNVVDPYEEIEGSIPAVGAEEVMKDRQEEELVGKNRINDIRLLKYLSIQKICDLMVEQRKVKYGLYMTSSEKADSYNRYEEFQILSMPYPGCEFFAGYREHNYEAKDMKPDWAQSHINRNLELPSSVAIRDIKWIHYKEWDLETLTVNYIKILRKHLTEGKSGLLVHCISGWDRTPLFISILRMSLWADGSIHRSLTPLEMLYLTIGYDWFLFGHQLRCRLDRKEEIIKFCCDFLKPLISVVAKETSDGENSNQPIDLDDSSTSAQSNGVNPRGSDAPQNPDTSPSPIPEEHIILEQSPKNLSTAAAEKDESSPSSGCSSDVQSTIGRRPSSPDDGTEPSGAKSTSPLTIPGLSRKRTESVSESDFETLNLRASTSPPPNMAKGLRSAADPGKEKLDAVRTIFIGVYFQSVNIGYQYETTEGLFGLAEKCAISVGLITPKPPE